MRIQFHVAGLRIKTADNKQYVFQIWFCSHNKICVVVTAVAAAVVVVLNHFTPSFPSQASPQMNHGFTGSPLVIRELGICGLDT